MLFAVLKFRQASTTSVMSMFVATAMLCASFAAIAAEGDSKNWQDFVELRRKFRVGELNEKEMWNQLTSIGDQISTLKPQQQALVLQTQASILQKTGYPATIIFFEKDSEPSAGINNNRFIHVDEFLG